MNWSKEPADSPPSIASPAGTTAASNGPDLGNLVERLQGIDMEELFINDLSLDQSQARVTIVGVPNQPGVAASVFQSIADAGIFVDMIVQSHKATWAASA